MNKGEVGMTGGIGEYGKSDPTNRGPEYRSSAVYSVKYEYRNQYFLTIKIMNNFRL